MNPLTPKPDAHDILAAGLARLCWPQMTPDMMFIRKAGGFIAALELLASANGGYVSNGRLMQTGGWLAHLGFAEAEPTHEQGKKRYRITPEGARFCGARPALFGELPAYWVYIQKPGLKPIPVNLRDAGHVKLMNLLFDRSSGWRLSTAKDW